MRLNSGKNIGHFEILGQLGSGGMGEVYLALDKQLNRKVAIKILPPGLAAKQDRMRRFNQEATAAAALNHPHIAHIYETGRDDDLQFIAMEYIDGETLRNKIHLHKTSLTKLLKYLVQVAEGLTKAHAAGIVHRDLKPDNIMITRDDYAKILDFGLAKLVEPEKPQRWTPTSSEIATALQHSLPGVVLGTVGYMSPEQAQGHVKEIDHRSDIFAFGCILFEAVTSQKAFEGKDALDSLHKIVHAPTPQIKELNPDAPPELQKIVRRCLAKEPDKRYQSIKDVGLELEEIRQDLKRFSEMDRSVQPSSSLGQEQSKTDSGRQLTSQTIASGTSQSMSSAEYLVNGIKQHKLAALIGVTAVVVGLTLVLYKFIGTNKSTTSAPALKMVRLTSTGKVNQAAISLDGKYVAYSQNEGKQEGLWLTQVAVANSTQIVPPIETQYGGITFSKDGNFIYVVRRDKDNPDGALYQVGVLGGNARKILANITSPITFSPDGKQIAFMRCRGCRPDQGLAESAIIITNVDGSNERKLAGLAPPELFSSGGPAWSPDGTTIACGAVHRVQSGPHRDVMAIRVSDGFMQPITSQRWDGAGWTNMRISWLSDNSGILVSGADQGVVSQIWYLSWTGDEARNITNDLNRYFQTSLTADSATLAAVLPNRVINLWVALSRDITGARKITSGADRSDGERGLSWAPDGRVVYCSMAGGREEIWIMEGDGRGNKQLSSTGQHNIEPTVSPDRRYIVWTSIQAGRPELWRMDIDGGNSKLLTSGGTFFQDVSPDGQWVIFTPPRGRLLKVSIDGGKSERVSDARAMRPTISPDGQFIACNYQDKEDEEFRVAILPFAGGPPIKLLDLPRSENAPRSENLIRWTPDGRAIAYIVTDNEVSNIWAQPLDGGPPKQLTDFKSERIFNFAWSRDGQKIALSRGTVNRDVVLITGFK